MESTEFFIFLFVHLSSLILGFGSVLVTDLYGLLWIRDRVRFTQIISVSGVVEKFVWAGWSGMVAAGIPLLILKGEIDNLMVIKLAFVALIGINGVHPPVRSAHFPPSKGNPLNLSVSSRRRESTRCSIKFLMSN